MESEFARRLRNGKEYDHLFPRPGGIDHGIKREASVGDTVHFIEDKAPENIWQTKAIARLLQGRNLQDTCRNVWNFVYQHIQYEKDEEGVEQVRSPRRVWWERKGDCDCFTSFISSVLLSMEPPIPHKYRITKYNNKDPDKIRWQHIYPVVPRNGRLDRKLERRSDYIVLDCVKDAYDSEQPYYEKQDFDCKMRLEYLDGLEEEGMEGAEAEYAIPPNVDAMDLAALYDEDQLGKAGFLKKVGSAVKKVKKTVGKGIRFVNRVANPATILLRNGFLLAMKINFLHLAAKLRYAYLSGAQAAAKGMDMNKFGKLKKILAKAEKIYHGAGGKTDKLRLAILKGKGNKNKDVPLAGFEGLDGVYADENEYNIIHNDNVNGLGALGEPATAATLAAATAALTAIGTALKSVKGIFPKGSAAGKEFDSEAGGESGGSGSGADTNTDAGSGDNTNTQDTTSTTSTTALVPTSNGGDNSTSNDNTKADDDEDGSDTKAVTTTQTTKQVIPVTDNSSSATDTSETSREKKSLMKDPVGWAKENPGKAAIGVLGIVGLAYVGYKAMNGNKKGGGSGGGLSGFGTPAKKRKRKSKRKNTTNKKSKIKAIKIL